MEQKTVFENVQHFIQSLDKSELSYERKTILTQLVDYMQTKIKKQETIRLVFICTHNSRRSHLTQIWAQTLAYYYGIGNVFCYSAGTEVTAIFPQVLKSLMNTGFYIEPLSSSDNPIYSIKFSENEPPIIGFSKRLNHKFNPTSNFAAILTCSQADEACPLVRGMEVRISIPFEDPKIADGSADETKKYSESSFEIAQELNYVFKQLNTNDKS